LGTVGFFKTSNVDTDLLGLLNTWPIIFLKNADLWCNCSHFLSPPSFKNLPEKVGPLSQCFRVGPVFVDSDFMIFEEELILIK
jgi:hypothetical protein